MRMLGHPTQTERILTKLNDAVRSEMATSDRVGVLTHSSSATVTCAGRSTFPAIS